LYYGRKNGMGTREILATRYGDMMDVISCMMIDSGNARQKKKKRTWTFDEAIALE